MDRLFECFYEKGRKKKKNNKKEEEDVERGAEPTVADGGHGGDRGGDGHGGGSGDGRNSRSSGLSASPKVRVRKSVVTREIDGIDASASKGKGVFDDVDNVDSAWDEVEIAE